MRARTKRVKTEYQWVSGCACFAGVDQVDALTVSFAELPVAGVEDVGFGGQFLNAGVRARTPEIRQYRMLMDVQLDKLQITSGTAQVAWDGDVCAWFRMGILETTWDPITVGGVVVADPSVDDNSEWYWRFDYPLKWRFDSQSNLMNYGEAHPSVPVHHDIAFRSRRRGSEATFKNRVTLLVATIDLTCMPTAPVNAFMDFGASYRILYGTAES